MQEYRRIQLISPSGKVWLSPAVYPKAMAEKRLPYMLWLEELPLPQVDEESVEAEPEPEPEPKGKLSLIPIHKREFPWEVLWKPDWNYEITAHIDEIIAKLELAWLNFAEKGDLS